MSDVQGSMFPDIVPDLDLSAPLIGEQGGPSPTPHEEGWFLLAASRPGGQRGTLGWHRIGNHAPWGLAVALCGTRGRVVHTSHELMIMCGDCYEQSLSHP